VTVDIGDESSTLLTLESDHFSKNRGGSSGLWRRREVVLANEPLGNVSPGQ